MYLAILERVDSRVQKALCRDTPAWRLKHACPACTYSIQNETELKFRMLFTMDGNDSLKRVLRRDHLYDSAEAANGDVHLIRISNELPDERQVCGDYYIPRDRVARWTNTPCVGASADTVSLYSVLSRGVLMIPERPMIARALAAGRTCLRT